MSKIEDEAVADLSTGWRKCKMSQAAIQELENMGLLQSQAVIQWRACEGEDYPFKGTLETVIFRDFVNVVLLFLCLNFSMLFCNFGESNCII